MGARRQGPTRAKAARCSFCVYLASRINERASCAKLQLGDWNDTPIQRHDAIDAEIESFDVAGELTPEVFARVGGATLALERADRILALAWLTCT